MKLVWNSLWLLPWYSSLAVMAIVSSIGWGPSRMVLKHPYTSAMKEEGAAFILSGDDMKSKLALAWHAIWMLPLILSVVLTIAIALIGWGPKEAQYRIRDL
jgi:hypothetical protein